MSLAGKNLHLCSCNGTMPLDAAALARALALSGTPSVPTMLCQKELAAFAGRADGDVVVACTQEARLFGDVAEAGGKTQTIRFVNIRETGGWSAEARAATPKIAALLALAGLPEPEPVPRVSYRSDGRLLIVGPAEAALQWAKSLAAGLGVTILVTGRASGADLPAVRDFPVYSGKLAKIAGWLGAFDVAWTQENPIDLDLCTRCNACVHACPESAIDFSYQIDLDRCKAHRRCVAACGATAAIDFARGEVARSERFDLVLDLQRTPHLTLHQPPQGYLAPGADAIAQAKAVTEIAGLTGEFEKPKYFAYKASICAHSRSQQPGCNLCLDVCSTAAIAADGDHVRVEPHLCMGCGACATVCPSGAMSYAYPTVPDLGLRLRTLLGTYAMAGGRDACVLLHAEDGRAAIANLARRGRGLPARVIPLEVHHVASVGLDVWLAALAHGASQVAVLAAGSEAPEYRAALERQMGYADTIAQALGYQGAHFRVFDGEDARALDAALWSWPAALAVRAPPASRSPPTSARPPRSRSTISRGTRRCRSGRSRFRPALRSARSTSTATPARCASHASGRSEGAILDQQEAPRLSFIEAKCVQCGLCAATCPERAITLTPRLSLAPEARQPRVINEAVIFKCTSCGKPLGTEKMVTNMLAKLAGHSMFATPGALDRLRMCADCRVVDLMKNERGMDIRDV